MQNELSSAYQPTGTAWTAPTTSQIDNAASVFALLKLIASGRPVVSSWNFP